MSLDMNPGSTISAGGKVVISENTLVPGDKLVITTDQHLTAIEQKIEEASQASTAASGSIARFEKLLENKLKGVRFVGIIKKTKAQVAQNKQLLTDFVGTRFEAPDNEPQIGDIVATSDKATFIYVSTGPSNDQFQWEVWTDASIAELSTKLTELQEADVTIKAAIEELKQQVGQGTVSPTPDSPSTVPPVTGPQEITQDNMKKILDTVKRDMFNNGIDIFKHKQTIPGSTIESPHGMVMRVPSMGVDKRGNLHFFAEGRQYGRDQEQIEQYYTFTNDAFDTPLKYKLLMKRPMNGDVEGVDETYSRTMDCATVYDKEDDIFYSFGASWIAGKTLWVHDTTNWKFCKLATMKWNNVTKEFDNVTVQTMGRAGNQIEIQGLPSDLHCLVSGCGTGIIHSSGKIVFPVFYAIRRDLGTGIGSWFYAGVMIGEKSGTVQQRTVTWTLKPYINNVMKDLCENNVYENEDGHLVMIARSEGGTSLRKARISRDMGETWEVYEPLDGKFGSDQYAAQGATISFVSRAGKRIVLSTCPQIEPGQGDKYNKYLRNQLTLYYLSPTSKMAIPVDVINYPGGDFATIETGGKLPFGGYSSLCYDAGKDGEKLFVHYEYKLGTQLQDLSYLIPLLNQYADKYDAVLNGGTTSTGPSVQAADVKDMPENFSSYLVTNEVPSTNSFSLLGSTGEEVKQFAITGNWLEADSTGKKRLQESKVAPGMIELSSESDSVDGKIRGEIVPVTGSVVSIALGFYFSKESIKSNWSPLISFYDDPDRTNSPKTGLEVNVNGTIHVRNGGGQIAQLQPNTLYNFVVKYHANKVELFNNGELIGTAENKPHQLNNLKASTHMQVGLTGAGRTFNYHIGNITIYDRDLTAEEMKSAVRSALPGVKFTRKVFEASNYKADQVKSELNAKIKNEPIALIDTLSIGNLDIAGKKWTGDKGILNLKIFDGNIVTSTKEGDAYLKVTATQGDANRASFFQFPKMNLKNITRACKDGFTLVATVKLPFANISGEASYSDYPAMFGILKGTEAEPGVGALGMAIGLNKGQCNESQLAFDCGIRNGRTITFNAAWNSNADNEIVVSVSPAYTKIFVNGVLYGDEGAREDYNGLMTLILGTGPNKNIKNVVMFKGFKFYSGAIQEYRDLENVSLRANDVVNVAALAKKKVQKLDQFILNKAKIGQQKCVSEALGLEVNWGASETAYTKSIQGKCLEITGKLEDSPQNGNADKVAEVPKLDIKKLIANFGNELVIRTTFKFPVNPMTDPAYAGWPAIMSINAHDTDVAKGIELSFVKSYTEVGGLSLEARHYLQEGDDGIGVKQTFDINGDNTFTIALNPYGFKIWLNNELAIQHNQATVVDHSVLKSLLLGLCYRANMKTKVRFRYIEIFKGSIEHPTELDFADDSAYELLRLQNILKQP